MVPKPTKHGIRLPNGDVLIATTQRDAKTEAAFQATVAAARVRNAARFAELRRAQQRAA